MKIRTVFQPDEEVEVEEADAEVSRLQGLVHICGEACSHPGPAAAEDKPHLRPPQPATKADPKTEPPVASSAPVDQAPPTEKG